mgnify:CR=1 FL=1
MSYVFGEKFSPKAGSAVGQYFQVARVKSVILGPTNPPFSQPVPEYKGPRDIGAITFELLYSPLSTSKSKAVSEPAYPMWYFVKQLPLVNEVVFIVMGPSRKLNDGATKMEYYYMPAYSMWNNPNHNAFPNMEEWADFLKQSINQPGYSGNAVADQSLPLGYTFQEKESVKDLMPFEGDTFIQGRFGQSIRLGSTVPVMKNFNTWSTSGENGDPITIILNSQGSRPAVGKFDPIVEDINRDGSAIWMTSTQEVILEDINSFPLSSFGVRINPQVQDILEVQRPPISNEFTSAEAQDKNSIG